MQGKAGFALVDQEPEQLVPPGMQLLASLRPSRSPCAPSPSQLPCAEWLSETMPGRWAPVLYSRLVPYRIVLLCMVLNYTELHCSRHRPRHGHAQNGV